MKDMDGSMGIDDMRPVFELLNAMVNDGLFVNYALGGAVAASSYIEPASTQDIDIFVVLQPYPGSSLLTVEPINEYLRSKGAVSDGEHMVYSGWPLHFLPPKNALYQEALARAKRFDYNGVEARVFSMEHLAAIALETGRRKDKNRLADFVESSQMDMGTFEDIVQRHSLKGKYEEWKKWLEAT